MDFKFDWKGIAAVLLIAVLSVGALWFPSKETLPDFSVAIKLRQALEGQASQLHLQLLAQLAAASGMSGAQGIVSLLLYLPPFILAACAILIYLSLRNFEHRRSIASAISLLFSLSLSALYFAPGVYSSESLGALLFCALLLCFSYLAGKQKKIMVAPSMIFALAAGYASPAFGVAGALLGICFLAGDYLKEKKMLVHYSLLIVAGAVGAALSPGAPSLFFSTQSLSNSFALFPLLIGAASCCVGLFILGGHRMDHAALAIAGLLSAGLSPLSGAILLTLSAAGGIRAAMDENLGKAGKLLCALLLAFFAVFAVAYPLSDAYKAAVIGLFVGAIFPVVMHSYGYKNGPMVLALGIGMLSLSFFGLVAYSLAPGGQFSPQYADKDASDALSSISTSAKSVGVNSEYASAARFFAPSAALLSQKDYSSYLSSGKPVPPSGAYLLLSVREIDLGEAGGGFESFYFIGNFSSSQTDYAVFASASGRRLMRQLEADGTFALRDGDYIDPYGQVYGAAPLSRMLMLEPQEGISNPYNRLIVLEEGTQVPYFIKMYWGQTGEVQLVSRFGKVALFRVK